MLLRFLTSLVLLALLHFNASAAIGVYVNGLPVGQHKVGVPISDALVLLNGERLTYDAKLEIFPCDFDRQLEIEVIHPQYGLHAFKLNRALPHDPNSFNLFLTTDAEVVYVLDGKSYHPKQIRQDQIAVCMLLSTRTKVDHFLEIIDSLPIPNPYDSISPEQGWLFLPTRNLEHASEVLSIIRSLDLNFQAGITDGRDRIYTEQIKITATSSVKASFINRQLDEIFREEDFGITRSGLTLHLPSTCTVEVFHAFNLLWQLEGVSRIEIVSWLEADFVEDYER